MTLKATGEKQMLSCCIAKLFSWPSLVSPQCFGIVNVSPYLLLPENGSNLKSRPPDLWSCFVSHPGSNSPQTTASGFKQGALPTLSARQASQGKGIFFFVASEGTHRALLIFLPPLLISSQFVVSPKDTFLYFELWQHC